MLTRKKLLEYQAGGEAGIAALTAKPMSEDTYKEVFEHMKQLQGKSHLYKLGFLNMFIGFWQRNMMLQYKWYQSNEEYFSAIVAAVERFVEDRVLNDRSSKYRRVFFDMYFKLESFYNDKRNSETATK